MITRIATVAFHGVEVQDVDVQVQISAGMPTFTIVGLPDKTVAESRERVRGALHALGLALPPKRITVNLSPADTAKEGSHFDLPIALGLLGAMEVIAADELRNYLAVGELALDGAISPVTGVLPAAVQANAEGRGMICPAASGPEAAWAGDLEILAAETLLALINHFKGNQVLSPPEAKIAAPVKSHLDLKDIKGQETAKRALEIAAAGGHNLLMSGPPGVGKSMLASRMPTILPPLDAGEALEVSMIHSLAGTLEGGGLLRERPYRDPHHSASVAALVGGGVRARPGEVSLAHKGVLFLDELPEFHRAALEALRQPLETGHATVSRANAHYTCPARFQLIAAMNPCRCGYLSDPEQACSRAPQCAEDYQNKLSGPLLDRIDMHVEVPPVTPLEMTGRGKIEESATVAGRVLTARAMQSERYAGRDSEKNGKKPATNAEVTGETVFQTAGLDGQAEATLKQAADALKLSARGFHRVLKVARTVADLEGSDTIGRVHVAEALSFRRIRPASRRAA